MKISDAVAKATKNNQALKQKRREQKHDAMDEIAREHGRGMGRRRSFFIFDWPADRPWPLDNDGKTNR